MKHISAGALDVAYLEAGPFDRPPVIMLHGFAYDAQAYDADSAQLAVAGRRGVDAIRFLARYKDKALVYTAPRGRRYGSDNHDVPS